MKNITLKKALILTSVVALGYFLYRKLYKKPFEEVDYDNFSGEDPSTILKEWKYCFDNKQLDKITNLYSSEALLVSTFDDIKKGRVQIKDYFKGLFDKEGLNVEFTSPPHTGKIGDLTIFTGVYIFSYIEDGKKESVKARYSILCQKFESGYKIIKQHSSAFAK